MADMTEDDTPMVDTETNTTTKKHPPKISKSEIFTTRTIRSPPFTYAHLQLLSSSLSAAKQVELDAIQVRQYCTAALKQFLGVAGLSISLDILKVEGADCWLRLPRDDLAAFAAAITAWQGTFEGDKQVTFRIQGCSDWLGSLVGQEGQEALWNR